MNFNSQTSDGSVSVKSLSDRRAAMRTFFTLYLVSLFILVVIGWSRGLHRPPEGDQLEYYNGAVSISRGNGYALIPQQSADGMPHLSAFRMPGPSLILALAFRIFGTGVSVARLCPAFFAAFAAPLMYLYARQATTTAAAALISSLLFLLHPVWNFMGSEVLSEPFFVPGLLLSLWLTGRAFQSQSSAMAQPDRENARPPAAGHAIWLLAGLSWGVTALIRPQGLPLVALIALLAVWRGAWRAGAVLVLGVVLLLSPWAIRNFMDFGRFEFLETVSGETFLGCNNPYVLSEPAMHGMWISPMRVPEYRARLANVHDDFQRRNIQNQIAFRFLKDNLASVPRLLVYKVWRWLTPITGSGGLTRILVLCWYGLFLLLMLMGAPLGVFKRSTPLSIALLCTFTFFVVTIAYWGLLTRGRMILELIWLPWAASGTIALCARSSWLSRTIKP